MIFQKFQSIIFSKLNTVLGAQAKTHERYFHTESAFLRSATTKCVNFEKITGRFRASS